MSLSGQNLPLDDSRGTSARGPEADLRRSGTDRQQWIVCCLRVSAGAATATRRTANSRMLAADRPEAARGVRERRPFEIIAWVVLPDHLHAIWKPPEGDADYSTRWALIKADFSRGIPKVERVRGSCLGKGERGIWQRRFWEHLIRDDFDRQRHLDYVHCNPVAHGHVSRAVEWPFSFFHRYRGLGWVTDEWGSPEEMGGALGEPA